MDKFNVLIRRMRSSLSDLRKVPVLSRLVPARLVPARLVPARLNTLSCWRA